MFEETSELFLDDFATRICGKVAHELDQQLATCMNSTRLAQHHSNLLLTRLRVHCFWDYPNAQVLIVAVLGDAEHVGVGDLLVLRTQEALQIAWKNIGILWKLKQLNFFVYLFSIERKSEFQQKLTKSNNFSKSTFVVNNAALVHIDQIASFEPI